MNEPLTTILARAAAIRRDGRACAFCLVVASRGSTPQEPGALMIVDDAASTFGTIGGGCVEAEVRRAAFGLLATARSAPLRFRLNHDYGWDDGLICGGTLELIVAPAPTPERLDAIISDINARRATHLDLSIEAASAADASAASGTKAAVPSDYRLHIPPRDRLYIAGAGHVGQAVARLALALEFEVHVFDDRADLIEQHLPAGAKPVNGDIAERLADAPLDDRTYCLVVTRGHRHDEQALHAVVGRSAAYVGMIGSRRKVKLIFDDLAAMGVSPEALAHVHAPVGLDIGAVTVEEIGVSIAAQLVEVRRRSARKPVERIAGPDPFEPLRADATGVSECGVNARG